MKESKRENNPQNLFQCKYSENIPSYMLVSDLYQIYIMHDVLSSVFRLKMKMVPISNAIKSFVLCSLQTNEITRINN